MGRHLGWTSLLWVLWTCVLSLAAQQPADPIRVRVTLVPVEVLVTDRHHRPILDLSREDFEILEDGVRQEIVKFSPHAFAESDRRRTILSEEGPVSTHFSEHRTFLFYMGRGRLNQRFGDVDDLIRFVREDLLPADRVAVMAYHRATDFTTDHEKIGRVLERYRDLSPEIEATLEQGSQGLAAVYGSGRMARSVLARINDIFEEGTGRVMAGEASEVRKAATARPGTLARVSRREMEQLQEEVVAAPDGGLAGLGALEEPELRLLTDLPMDDYLQARTGTGQDLMNLYAAIEYLRLAQGEKNLVFFTEHGLFLPRMEDDRNLAALAADARVRIHVVQTGGVFLQMDMSRALSGLGGRLGLPGTFASDLAVARGSARHQAALQAVRSVAQSSGGQAFIHHSAKRALQSIDSMTRSAYLLAYNPANPDVDGRFRRIIVRVHRKDVHVHFRSGYFARPLFVLADREQMMIYARTVSAAGYGEEIQDIPLEAEVKREPATDEGTPVTVSLNILPAEDSFTPRQEGYKAIISIAIFFLSRQGTLQHEEWHMVERTLPEETYLHVLEEGFAAEGRFVIPGGFERGWVKIVVYDPTSDQLGSIMSRM